MAARFPRSSGPWAWQVEILEGVVAGKKKRAEEAIKGLMKTGRVLRFVRTRVEDAEREVSGMEQHLKEARRRLNSSQEKAASMEERDALVRKGSTCQELRRQKERLQEAMRWEDDEERKEATKAA